ncbi:hypothetical protein [Nocardia veterana]|uniref:Uncharacterized protein n=1 Tax=Nocardia veterana TaxID=132249 RepID=A0A7X6RJP5_9NOCA|nr:hypothetical protein [Nocardia veterana]NKY87893.1 hypothetical protein [Nocardia veterana]
MAAVSPTRLARAHGVFNLVSGAWPLLARRSFEAVFGAKTDRWLLYTVSGLLLGNGLTQLTAEPTAAGVRAARQCGTATALTLLSIDLVYVPAGTIPKTYLLDAAMELGWITAWRVTAHRPV